MTVREYINQAISSIDAVIKIIDTGTTEERIDGNLINELEEAVKKLRYTCIGVEANTCPGKEVAKRYGITEGRVSQIKSKMNNTITKD